MSASIATVAVSAVACAQAAPQVGSDSGFAAPIGSSSLPASSLPASPLVAYQSAPATPKPSASKSPATKAPSVKPTTKKPATPSNLASSLKKLPSSTRQVVIVHAAASSDTHATLETFIKTSTGWHPEFGTMAARVGKDGMSTNHVEGTPNTPEGMFAFGPTMYGVNANPGVKYAYHNLVTDDWWNEEPGTSGYNTFEHVSTDPGGASEALWKETVDYQYFAFIEYNVPAVGNRGSGVFLHVATSNATAGCVSLPKADLVKVLTWLDPKDNPRIVISTDSNLHLY
jgi:L,D-peptidoglycan transpeptidase YkuD (ErfK/YbiS/YcfS/YnhG family)